MTRLPYLLLNFICFAPIQILRDIADEMRLRGNPCVVATLKTFDGVGSSVTRHIASWLYAAEVGCDWVHPDFNQGNVSKILDEKNTPSLYCHVVQRPPGFDPRAPLESITAPRHCSRVSWILYFNFYKASVPQLPATAKTRKILVSACNIRSKNS